jgi:hypothetical protein
MFSELSRDLLSIYLNDHLAGATVGCELARRAAGSNRGTELGDFLAEFAAEAEAHRAQLEDVMMRLGIGRDPFKIGAGWLAEKAGRLKLNGRLFEYSPLSRVVELESLILASTGRQLLWRSLAVAALTEQRIADVDFTDLALRAERDTVLLSEHHTAAIEEVLASNPRPSPGG